MRAKEPQTGGDDSLPVEKLGASRDLPLDAIIARRLIKDIVQGRYKPGQWIREQEVASRFGVSRTPVRNAFRQVSRAGFLDVRPWRGAQVLELSAEDTRYILDMLEVVYGVAMRIAAETVPEERFPLLDKMMRAGDEAAEHNSIQERVEVAFQIGRRLARWSRSAMAYEMVERVGSLAQWQHRFFDFDVPAAAQKSLDLHHQLIEAVKRRQPDAAERVAREIVALSRSFLVPRIQLAATMRSGQNKGGSAAKA